MNLRLRSHFSGRASQLTLLFSLIACLAGFTPAQQAQTAHFSGAVGIAGGAAAEASRKGLATEIGVRATPDIQTTHGDFGSVNVGASSASPIAMVFTFDAPVTLGSTAVVTQGAANLDFTDAGGGTCKANTAYNASNTCTVNVTFKPRFPGMRYGAAELLDGAGNLLAMGYVQGTGVGPLAVFANTTSGDYASGSQSLMGRGFRGPYGVTTDASDNIIVADAILGTVSEIVAAGGYNTIKTLASGLGGPYGVAVDGSGNIFVAVRGADVVTEIVAAGGYATVKNLGTGFHFGGPNGIAVDGSGNVFVGDWVNSVVYEIVAAGGYTTVKTLGSGSFACADGVAVDGSGNVFVADFCHGAVKEILAAGGYATIKTLQSGLPSPAGISVDGSGNVFVTGYGGTAMEIVAAGGYTTVRNLGGGFNTPNGIAVDESGDVFVTNWGDGRVVKLDYADPPSLTFTKTAVGDESSDSPQTVTVSNNGNADLKFPLPAAGRNPSVSSAFTLDSATTCPDLGISSTAGKLAAGASCDYAVDFIPVAGMDSGSLTLTDNSLNASPAVTQTIPLQGTVIGPHLAFTTAPPASLAVGQGPGTVAVSVEDSSDNVMTGSVASITLTVTGPNSYSNVYTATASSGVAMFSSLAPLSVAGSYSYTATDVPDGLTQTIATESVWTPHLAFTTPPPANLSVKQAPGTVAVSVEDASNNVMTVSSGTVKLTVTGPNSYSKVYTATAASGVAIFSSLASLSVAGSYSYTATDVPDGLTQAVASESVTWPPPFGYLAQAVDSITSSTTVGQPDSLKVTGWVADLQDGAPLSNVTVYVDGTSIGTPTLGIARPDIASTYGSAFLNSGFRLVSPAAALALGKHKVTVVAIDSGGRSTTLGPFRITVAATAGVGSPFGALGLAVDSTTGSTTVSQSHSLRVVGWVADPQDGAPLSNVQVYVDGVSIGMPTLGIARSDVAKAYNNNAYLNSGYRLLFPASSLSVGTHTVTVIAIDSGGRSTTFGPLTITVQ